MKFRSTTGSDIHIALTSGHTALITSELTELHKIFHKEAIARGALPEGVEPEVTAESTGFNRKDAIIAALESMLDGGDEGDFKNDGTPDLRKVTAKVGFRVDREEVDAAWAEVSKAD